MLAAVVVGVLLATSCVIDGSWTVLPSIASEGAPDPLRYEVTDVSCVATDFCMTVGQYLDEQVAVDESVRTTRIWDGTAWLSIDGPQPAGMGILGPVRVSCGSRTLCAAAFEFWDPDPAVDGSTNRFAIWDGVSWTQVPMDPSYIQSGPDFGCAPDGSCVFADPTVGTVTFAGGSFHTFPIAVQATPEVDSLVCLSDESCLGVGAGLTRWDGQEWQIIAPRPPSPHSEPNFPTYWSDFSCASPTNCFAVGVEEEWNHFPSGSKIARRPVAARFDGLGWTLSPLPFDSGVAIHVSCADAAACVVLVDAVPSLGLAAMGWIGNQWLALPQVPDHGSWALSCGGERCLSVGLPYGNDLPFVASYDWAVGS